MIPEALLYDPSISAEAVRVYGVLVRHGDKPASCHPSHRRIAEFIGKSPRSIQAWIRELEDAGWVQRFARFTADGDPDTNGYYIRVVQRGVRVEERGGSTLPGMEGYALGDASKESKVEREQLNDTAFDRFWEQYPTRNGKKLGKANAKRQWDRLGYIAKQENLRAVVNYAASGVLPKDPERWLRDHCYLDWLEPATPESPRQRSRSASRAAIHAALAEREPNDDVR